MDENDVDVIERYIHEEKKTKEENKIFVRNLTHKTKKKKNKQSRIIYRRYRFLSCCDNVVTQYMYEDSFLLDLA